MVAAPLISVVTSVYNGEKYLREAIDSILNQTFKDFEFLIINDGSTDSSRDIILSYDDPRIRLVDNGKNIGLTRSLNKGLRLAKGEYITRMDTDDISTPDRLGKQVAYMDTHPEKALLGGQAIAINSEGDKITRWHHPIEPGLLRWSLLFGNQFIHSAIILRSALLRAHRLSYDKAFPYAEDYDLWQKISQFSSVANLADVVIYRREHSRSISALNSQRQEKTVLMLISRGISAFLRYSTEEESVAQISRVAVGQTLASVAELEAVGRLVCHMLEVFFHKWRLTPKEEKLVIRDARARWLTWVKRHTGSFGWKAVRVYHKFPELVGQYQYRKAYWKLIIKMLIGRQRIEKFRGKRYSVDTKK